MKEQEIKETLSDIKDLMERSQKVVFLDGAAGMVVGLWALLGAAVVSFWVYGSFSPLWGAWINPVRDADWSSFLIVAGVCSVVFCAAFKTVWDMSRQRARREGLEFRLDAGSRHLLGRFFTVMVVGGLVCLTPLMNGLWNMVPGIMLVFYGLAMVVISPIAFKVSVTKYIGYADIVLGIVALAFAPWGIMLWAIGFGIIHIVWGIWFHIRFDGKK
jgi:hypothetical protein